MKKCIVILLLCLAACQTQAYDFVANGIYYNITDRHKKTVEVTHWEEQTADWGKPLRVYHHTCAHHHKAGEPMNPEHERLIQLDKDAKERERTAYIGKVVVPAKVRHKGKTYKVTGIGDGSFYGREQLEEVVLPSTITYIGKAAFEDCVLLHAIRLPAAVRTIRFAAFRRCLEMKEVILPEQLTELGIYSFSHCRKLKYVRMPFAIKSFSENTFLNCPQLKSIELPQPVPPVVKNDEGLSVDLRKIVFYVPAKALHLYRDDTYWSRQNVKPIDNKQ